MSRQPGNPRYQMLSRHGLFYFRMRLPGGKEIRRALGTRDKREALRLSYLHLSALGHITRSNHGQCWAGQGRRCHVSQQGGLVQRFSGDMNAKSANESLTMTAQDHRVYVDQYIKRIQLGRKLIADYNKLNPYIPDNMAKLHSSMDIESLNAYVITWINDYPLVQQLKAQNPAPFTRDQASELIQEVLQAQNGRVAQIPHTGRSDIPL
jgi:hypothetical protein